MDLLYGLQWAFSGTSGREMRGSWWLWDYFFDLLCDGWEWRVYVRYDVWYGGWFLFLQGGKGQHGKTWYVLGSKPTHVAVTYFATLGGQRDYFPTLVVITLKIKRKHYMTV